MNTFLLITKSSQGKQQKTNKRSEPRLGFKGLFALGRTKNVHVQQEKLTHSTSNPFYLCLVTSSSSVMYYDIH